MVVELISVGTEILLGNIVNTNAAYLAEKCALLGCSLYHQTVVGDNEERLEAAVRQAMERSDVVILTGGLGPTKDDMTKEVVAKVFKRELRMDEHSKTRIQEFFDKIGSKKVTENNWKQALAPEGAIVIDNLNGTAPGLIIEDKEQGKRAILIPGPPGEMKPMFERDIAPYLNRLQPEGIYSHMVKLCGIGESQAETMVSDLMDAQTNPTLAPYAKTGEVHFRVTAKAENEAAAEELMRPMIEKLYRRFGNAIYTISEEETLEASIVALLKERKMTVTTAESCTGGLLAGRLMNVAGASDVYREGYITYADASKEKLLGVRHETLTKHGAVSEETASEMAFGAAKEAGADAALSVTGIAGPGGGTEDKPVGLVYIGCAVDGRVKVRRFQLTGNREKNRNYAVVRALTFLREELLLEKAPQGQ
ncbi:MAG: competence/damage-inducible protein A [Coprococcus sp.]|nr:competence/damage-inducible protein A [Coprococcus sp.]